MISNETPDKTPPMQYQRKHVTALFLVVSFEKTCQKLWLRASSRRVPNISKQMKALGVRPRAYIYFSVFGTRDEALALILDT